ncbi:hypothetical protein B0H19DRAFT_1060287 [Mycena capillaripes]|nr:hypothetical protein B0H19DRAFT_1060287 [Mycena capillaripes]
MTRGGETPVLGDERKQLLDQPGRVLLWDVLLWLRLLFGSGCTDTPCNLQQEEGLLPGTEMGITNAAFQLHGGESPQCHADWANDGFPAPCLETISVAYLHRFTQQTNSTVPGSATSFATEKLISLVFLRPKLTSSLFRRPLKVGQDMPPLRFGVDFKVRATRDFKIGSLEVMIAATTNQYNDSRNLVHPASRLLLGTGLETAIFIPVYSWQQRVCSNCRGSSSMKDERAPICKATLLSSLSTIWESYVEYLVQFRVLMASGSRATVNRSHLKAVEGLESSLLLPRTVQRVLAGLDSCWVKIMEGRIGKAYCEEVVVRKKEAKGSPRALVWLLSGKNAGMWMWEKYHEATETTDWVVELERKYKARNA